MSHEQAHTKTVLETALADFKRSAEITRDVRFQANLRLSGRQRGSAYIVSLLSLYVISLSLIPNIVELKPFQSQILLGCSIVLSVFVIFTSLIDGAQNFFHQGELLHQCARKIATVHHALKTIDVFADPAIAKGQLEALQKTYQAALDECPINHENVDFYKEVASKPHLFPQQYNSWIPQTAISFGYKLLYWTLGKLWMAPHVTAFLVISLVVYFSIFLDPHPIGK
jgi:SMODS and SLOG-associating 2TM effector domain family 5